MPALGELTAYSIGSSTLTIGTGSPVTLPTGLTSSSAGAIAVSRNNSFVYVGGLNYIYCYSIGSSGALTLVTTSSVPVTANIVSMDTSPDGDYLFALDASSQDVYQFALNTTTGALGTVSAIGYKIAASATNAPKSIRAGATGTGVVVAALGTAGDAIFTYSSSSGLTWTQTLNTGSTTLADDDVAIDSTGTYLYVARSGYVGTTATNEVVSYTLSTATVFATVATGTTPGSILLDSTGAYLYTANRGASTISQFSVASGTVTALATASFPSGMVVTSLARDSTGKYVFDGGIASTSNLQMFTLSSGALTSATSESPGYDTSGLLLATTH
jgi:6-phosphogluconolactonase (cycloisomerase 2 family)